MGVEGRGEVRGSKSNKVIILFFDIFVAALEHCVQFWIPQYKKTF